MICTRCPTLSNDPADFESVNGNPVCKPCVDQIPLDKCPICYGLDLPNMYPCASCVSPVSPKQLSLFTEAP